MSNLSHIKLIIDLKKERKKAFFLFHVGGYTSVQTVRWQTGSFMSKLIDY